MSGDRVIDAPRLDLRGGSVNVGDDEVMIVFSSSGEAVEQRTITLPLSAIARVRADEGGLTILLEDGSGLALSLPDADETGRRIVGACQVLPEVVRGLRSMGGPLRERTVAEADRSAWIAPFLRARSAAQASGEPRAILAALDAAQLASSMDAVLAGFAEARAAGSEAKRRALMAELEDATVGCRRALAASGVLANELASDIEDLARWRSWTAAVRGVFVAADRAWPAIAAALSVPAVRARA